MGAFSWLSQHFDWLFGGALALIGASIGLSFYQDVKRRREALEEAARMGLTPVEPEDVEAGFSLQHPLFQRGRGGAVQWAAEGSAGGMRARLFDYRYSINTGRSSTVYTQTVASFELPRELPSFQMYPEGFLDRLTDRITHADIDFDGFADFSDNYVLRGPDQAAIRALFTPAVLMALGQKLGWTVEGEGRTLIVYKPNQTAEVSALPDFLAKTVEAAGAFALR